MLAEKPLISEDTDLLEPTLLDELICHISSLASVYHKPPSAFVEGRTSARRFTLPARAEPTPPTAQTEVTPPPASQATVIPSHPPQGDSLIGDLIGMDFGGGMPAQPAAPMPSAAISKSDYEAIILSRQVTGQATSDTWIVKKLLFSILWIHFQILKHFSRCSLLVKYRLLCDFYLASEQICQIYVEMVYPFGVFLLHAYVDRNISVDTLLLCVWSRRSYKHLIFLLLLGNSHSGVDLLGADLGGLQVSHLSYITFLFVIMLDLQRLLAISAYWWWWRGTPCWCSCVYWWSW